MYQDSLAYGQLSSDYFSERRENSDGTVYSLPPGPSGVNLTHLNWRQGSRTSHDKITSSERDLLVVCVCGGGEQHMIRARRNIWQHLYVLQINFKGFAFNK